MAYNYSLIYSKTKFFKKKVLVDLNIECTNIDLIKKAKEEVVE